MKKSIQILLLLLLAISFTSFIGSDSRFIGKWKTVSEGQTIFINFDKDCTAYFILDGQKMGGKDFVVEGHIVNMTYEINDSIRPNAIDIVLRKKDDRIEVERIKGIYEFINDDKLKLNLNFERGGRPKSFNAEGTQVFERTKE